MTKAILINYDFCTGCHSCEVACKKILDLPKGEFGIKVTEVGPFKYSVGDLKDKWEWTYMPVITQVCDMCEERLEQNKMPMCVQHCQGWCMYYGEADELVKKMDGQSRWTLLTNH
jgi:Fe-S-cluster-containing dehydrogenase component